MAALEIVFAGFGGQGILSMGKFFAYAGMDENLNVSWLPSYGPEMRGGTANCSVIVSDQPIGSPIVTRANAVIVMNRPSLEKFEEEIEPKGLLIIDTDMVNAEPTREDIEVIKIPAQTEAEALGDRKIANMVLLGALVEKTKIVPIEVILQSLKNHGKASFYEINKKALEKGAEYV